MKKTAVNNKLIFTTERLGFRTWKGQDVELYYHMNQHPQMIAATGGPLTRDQVNTFITLANEHHTRYGYGLWAVTLKTTDEFLGFIGLRCIEEEMPFAPAVEISWRLGINYWGKGYATEGAQTVLKRGFDIYQLPEIVAYTTPQNTRSLHVINKLGLKRDIHGDFHHPRLPLEHPLSLHVLYRRSIKNHSQ